MKGVWRAHFALAEILQAFHETEPDEAEALAVQASKMPHQVAVDHGEWRNAVWLMPTPDPLDLCAYAGSEREMEAVYQRYKAMKVLSSKLKDSEGGLEMSHA